MDLSFIDSVLEDYRNRVYFPDAVCQVFDTRGVCYSRAFGNADTGKWFDLASVSKLICTVMLLLAIEEGYLALEDLVLDQLPEAGSVTREYLSDITVARLMTHTAGLPAWYPFYANGRPFLTALEHVLADTDRIPDKCVYSDLGFMLLGMIFERTVGISLPEGLERYIKEPLDIRDMAYGPVDAELAMPSSMGNQIEHKMCAERGLSFSKWRPDGVAIRGTCNDGNAFYYFGGVSGHAGIFSTARALSKLGKFLLTTERPIFIRAMEENVCGRGIGFDKSDVFPDGCGHKGFTGTSLWVSRQRGLGAVILTNKFYCCDGTPGDSDEFRRAVHYGLLEQTPRNS